MPDPDRTGAPPPPAPARPPAVYDPSGLRGLGPGRDADERERVLDLLMRVPYLMQRVTRAVILRDPRALATHAHELRRCCWAFGAEALHAPLGQLESMGERGDFRGARQALDRASHEHARLLEALGAHLSGLRPR